MVDFNSLTPDQKQAVICSRVMQNYASSMLDSSSNIKVHSRPDALVKIYACFLILDHFFFQRSEDIRYQCLAQLADTFDDYSKYSSALGDTVNKYLASWKSRRIRFADDPNATPTIADLPILFSITSDDLSKTGYYIDPILISQYAHQYCDDFSANAADIDSSSIESTHEKVLSDSEYISQINQTFDELKKEYDFVSWDGFRAKFVEGFKNIYPDPSQRPSPQCFVIEYLIVTYIECFKAPNSPLFTADGKLSDFGEYYRDLALLIGNYGVEKGYITDISWKTFQEKLSKYSSAPSQISDSSFNSTKTKERKTQKKSSYRYLIIAGLVMIGLVIFCLIFSNSIPASSTSKPTSSSSTSTSSKMTAPTAMPGSVSKPSTGILWHKGNDEELAPFDVTASGNRDYVLLLVQNGKAVRSYYIRHGETLSVSVPLGTYQVYYACATIHSSWYGHNDLWKSQTEYYKSQKTLEFELDDGYYYGYTLELSVSSSGGSDYAYESSESTWNSLF